MMRHKSIDRYSSIPYKPMGSIRVNGHTRLSSANLVSNRKSCSEKGPEPLQLSDVVWRACEAVEQADRKT